MSQDPRALLQKGERSLNSAKGGFSFFGGKEDKYQDAADAFLEAANAFRMQNQMIDAGKAYERAADVQTNHLNDPDDAANTLVDAFKVYRKDDPKAAVRCVEVAINRYCAKGNFRRAASHMENLGDLCAQELGNPKKAVESYEKAAQWYEGDNAVALASRDWLKAADIVAGESDYKRAIALYEKLIDVASNGQNKHSVRDYMFKAGLCHLAVDLVSAERALAKYREIEPSFLTMRDGILFADLVSAVRDKDQDRFTDKLYRHDQVMKLDKLVTRICVQIKNSIVKEEEDEDDLA